MKKFLPILCLIMIFVGLLVGQIVFDLINTNAKFTQIGQKENIKLNKLYQKVLLDKDKPLRNTKSKVKILNFWASWCLPCLKEFSSLKVLREKYKEEDLGIYAITSDSPKEAEKIIKKMNLNFKVVFDKNGLFDSFNIDAVPYTIIYSKGKVVQVSKGETDFTSRKLLKLIDDNLK